MNTCKVCKLISKNHSAYEYINYSIVKGLSSRQIAKEVIRRFSVSISYESVRRHRVHREKNIEIETGKERDYPIAVVRAKPVQRAYLSRE